MRAGLASAASSARFSRRCTRSYFITGEINTPVADVPAKLKELEERFGADGRVSHLDGLSVDFDDWHFNVRPSNTEPLLRLNLEGALRGAHGTQARRGARSDPRMMDVGHVSDRKPPYRYSAYARVGFSDTDAQGVVYYGRYMPYFDLARTEYHRHLGRVAIGNVDFAMRAVTVEYLAPARFDDLLEIFVRVERIGTHEHHVRPCCLPRRRRRRHVDGDCDGDAGLHRARRAQSGAGTGRVSRKGRGVRRSLAMSLGIGSSLYR